MLKIDCGEGTIDLSENFEMKVDIDDPVTGMIFTDPDELLEAYNDIDYTARAIKALRLMSDKGLKLGPHYYAVELYDNNKSMALTRYLTECEHCPHSDMCLYEDSISADQGCCNLGEYSSTYDFNVLSTGNNELNVDKYEELTPTEKLAIELIFKYPVLADYIMKR